MSSELICVGAGARISFLSKAECHSIVCMDHILLICSSPSMHGHLGCLYVLSIVNNAAMNKNV